MKISAFIVLLGFAIIIFCPSVFAASTCDAPKLQNPCDLIDCKTQQKMQEVKKIA